MNKLTQKEAVQFVSWLNAVIDEHCTPEEKESALNYLRKITLMKKNDVEIISVHDLVGDFVEGEETLKFLTFMEQKYFGDFPPDQLFTASRELALMGGGYPLYERYDCAGDVNLLPKKE